MSCLSIWQICQIRTKIWASTLYWCKTILSLIVSHVHVIIYTYINVHCAMWTVTCALWHVHCDMYDMYTYMYIYMYTYMYTEITTCTLLHVHWNLHCHMYTAFITCALHRVSGCDDEMYNHNDWWSGWWSQQLCKKLNGNPGQYDCSQRLVIGLMVTAVVRNLVLHVTPVYQITLGV